MTSMASRETVRRRIVQELGAEPVDEARVRRVAAAEVPLLDGPDLDELVADVLSDLYGLGSLDALLADDDVSDVMVNGNGDVWVERSGRLERASLTLDRDETRRLIERTVAPLGLRVDRASPIAEARLPDGSRVHAIIEPLAVDGPCLAIRRFRAADISLYGFADVATADFLRQAVRDRRNIVISGGTGAGKTTLLNSLAAHIPTGERIVTIEEAAELKLPQEHVVRLEARTGNSEGIGRVAVRDLVRAALRMRPDRIVVGECRGGEALDMLQAMNTGHEGSLSTCHANSPDDALRRLETMVLMAGLDLPLTAVQDHLTAAIHLVVQVARRAGGRREITEVAEVVARPGVGAARTRPVGAG